jgi:hypothetical protein
MEDENMIKLVISLVLILMMNATTVFAVNSKSCDQELEKLLGQFCVLPTNNSGETLTFCAVTPVKVLETAVMAACNNSRKNPSPREMAAAVKAEGWDEPMWIVKYPEQDVLVRIPGKTVEGAHIKAGTTIVTMASDTVEGRNVVAVLNINLPNSGLTKPIEYNGWIDSDGVVTIIDKINATLIEKFA